MLKQGTIQEVNDHVVEKRHGHLVITTRYYPRFFPRNLVDDYTCELAPTKSLLKEFKNLEKKLHDHNKAFAKMNYEKKFNLSEKAYQLLKHYSELSKKQDVYLLCYCKMGECCHRELLLLMAKKFFKIKIDKIFQPYKIFKKRLLVETSLQPTNEKN